jgi:apolipoprotein N-acyltransferase
MGAVAGAGLFEYTLAQTGWPAALLILALRVLFWAAMARLAERSARTLPAWLAVLAPPLLAAGVETVVLAVSPHGSNGSLAHSQLDFLPVVQVAAIGGAPAIVFVVLCAGGLGGLVAARLMGAPIPKRQLGLAALVVLAVEAAALGYGAARLQSQDSGPRVPVSLVVTDQFDGREADWARVWSAYGPAVEAAAKPGAVVVLPEKTAWLTSAQAEEVAGQLSAIARRRGATLVVGLEVRGAGHWNRALVAQPDGRVAWYDKRRPAFQWEPQIRPGKAALVVPAAGVRTGVAICKDMHFPSLGREYGRGAVPLVVVLAWDFVQDGWISDRLTVLRGVESGYAIVRSTRRGVSSVSDRFGRIIAEAPSQKTTRTLSAQVVLAARPQPTPYARFGDAFGWCCFAGAFVLTTLVRRSKG